MLGETGSTCPARDDIRSIPEIPGSQLIVIDPVLNWCEQADALMECRFVLITLFSSVKTWTRRHISNRVHRTRTTTKAFKSTSIS
jgi:hypothetical protein